MTQSLKGTIVLGFCLNLPAPKVLSKLADLGAQVCKIEPLQGDPLFHTYPEWYKKIHEKIEVVSIDLKSDSGQSFLHQKLKEADVLVTSFRPSSLKRVGMDEESLLKINPEIFHMALVGHMPPHQERAGHDLTYQASVGLIKNKILPTSLHVDLLGAQICVSEILSAIIAKKKGTQIFALEEATKDLIEPVDYQATIPQGLLGGSHFLYNIYETKSGAIALAALEPHFQERLKGKLNLNELTQEGLTDIFKQKKASDWEQWANQHDIPLAKLKD